MMDLLSMLKMANIFSPSGQTAPQQFPVGSIGGPQIDQIPQDPNQQSTGLDLNAAIQGLLNPKDEQFQNYANMIQAMPRPEQYQPSKFRKVAAAIAGMGTGSPVGISNGAVLGYKSNIPEGLKVQQAINDEPYNKALSTWANQIEPTGKISQMEQTRNSGNRATALGTLQRQQSQEKIDALAAQNEVKNEQNQQNIDIRRAREEAYVKAKNFAADHPTYKSVVDENGELYFYNPQDPNAEPIKSGLKQTTPLEKAEFQVQGTIKAIEARNKAAVGLEGVKQLNRTENLGTKQTNALELEREKQPNRIEVKKTPSGNSPNAANKPLLPAQITKDRINKAQKLVSERPDLKGYIVFDKNKSDNIIDVHIPPAGYFGNEQKRMEAYNLLFGQPPVPGVSQTQASPAQTGKVLMLSPDGKTKGYVPQSQHDTAIKQGYKDTK